jgi:hypothetical protein
MVYINQIILIKAELFFAFHAQKAEKEALQDGKG